MEKSIPLTLPQLVRKYLWVLILVCAVAFAGGILLSLLAVDVQAAEQKRSGPKVVYPQKTELDFEGLAIEGEIRNPSEFYYQARPEEKFDSLVKRRPHFHREMLRDVVMSQ